jgi:hypothetical protein
MAPSIPISIISAGIGTIRIVRQYRSNGLHA